MKKLLGILMFSMVSTVSFASAVSVGGFNFEETIDVEGHELVRLGAGIRSKFILNVYALGAYSETKLCEPTDIISVEEAKYMRLVVLMKKLPGSMVADALNESINKNMPANPSAELKEIKDLLAIFNFTLYRGQKIEFISTPEKGFYVAVDGVQKGSISENGDLARLVWTTYFTEDTCCKRLKKEVLAMCQS